jgi:hypothetical protein
MSEETRTDEWALNRLFNACSEAREHTVLTNLGLKSGLLWKCPCDYVNIRGLEICEGCGRPRDSYRISSDAVKKNTYRVTWEHKDGHVSTSVEIDAPIFGDVIVEHIHVLTEFRAIFHDGCPVAKILKVELVRENW